MTHTNILTHTHSYALLREALENIPFWCIPALFGVQDLAEASTKMANSMKALITIASQSLVSASQGG